jgi:hypothetical protein
MFNYSIFCVIRIILRPCKLTVIYITEEVIKNICPKCSVRVQQIFSDGGKTLCHVQMEENKLYLMFRGGKIATFNVQMGTTTLFTAQMGNNKLNLLFRWGTTTLFTVQMGDYNSTVFDVQFWDNNSIYCSDRG